MKIKNYELLDSHDVLSKLLNNDMQVSIETKFKFLPKFKEFSSEAQMINQARDLLITKYGEKNEDGRSEIKDEAKRADFFKEYNELLNVDTNTDLTGITLEELASLSPTMQDLVVLEPVIIK